MSVDQQAPVLYARNRVRSFGRDDAPVIVLAHGFGCDQTMWRFVVPDLARDHRVVTFDYVGAGRSDKDAYDPARYGSMRGYAQDVLDVVDQLDLRDVTFVGHSVSSMIGVLASVERPSRFRRLVLIGPSPRYIDDPPYRGGFSREDIDGLLDVMDRNFMGWAALLAPKVARASDHPDVAEELRESFCSTDPRFLRTFAEITFRGDNRADLPKVTVPTLVLQCSEDDVAPEEVGRYCAREIPGARFHQLRATGHCPHMSDPEETLAAIRAFLAADESVR
jgi:sigma-B regulation protein RsbQ